MLRRKHSAASGRHIGSSILTVPVLAGIAVLTGAGAASAQWGYRDYYDPYRYDDGYYDPYRSDGDGYYDPYRDQYLPRRYQQPRPGYRNRDRTRRRAVQRQRQPRADIDLAVTSSFSNENCTSAELCTVEIRITNNGPGQYKGPLKIRNRLLAGRPFELGGAGPRGWECRQRGSDTYCRFRPGGFQPGQTVSLDLAYRMPSEAAVGEVKNCAGIQWGTSHRTSASVSQIQRALAANGYSPGQIDGRPGRKTRDAILRYQRDNGIRATGIPTDRFLKRLFRDEMTAGRDLDSENDRACSTVASPRGETDRYAGEQPGDAGDAGARAPAATEAPPRDDAAQPADTARSRIEDDRPGEPDPAADSRRGPPRAGVPAEEAETARQTGARETPASRHLKWKSDFHKRDGSSLHEKNTSRAKVESGPLAPLRQAHAKAKSDFRSKSGSEPHAKATSGAIPQHAKWKSELHEKYGSGTHDKATTRRSGGHDKGTSAFHRKYKSVQHAKRTTGLSKVHSKDISRVIHSKARSAITNRDFRGEVHDKGLSRFHKKYTSSTHDKKITKAPVPAVPQ